MKRLLKKGLSLLLAVLMVASMLPTSAWAVTFADGEDSGREETPIVDEGGDISSGIHTSGGTGTVRDRYDNPLTEEEAEETEEPVDPDPSDVPANPLWSNRSVRAIINPDGSWRVTVTTTDTEGGAGSGAWGLALIPNATRGGGMPSDFAAGLDGSVTTTWANLSTDIKGATKLTDADFAVTGGVASSQLHTDTSGTFTIESDDTTKLPELSYLQSELGLSSPADIIVIFFAKGSSDLDGNNTHVLTTQAKYGSEVKGVPSTNYILNKSTGTLTFVSGSIGTSAWNPKDDSGNPIANNTVVSGDGATVTGHGKWNGDTDELSVPVYNTYPSADYPSVNATIASPSLPAGVSGGTLTNENIPSGATVPVDLTVGANSGTIVLPVTVTDPDGGGQITTAEIRVTIVSGAGITLAPITIDVDYGFDTEQVTDDVSVVAVNRTVSSTTSALEWGAVFFNLAGSVTGTNSVNWKYTQVNGVDGSTVIKPSVNKTGVYWTGTSAANIRELLALNPDPTKATSTSATQATNRVSGDGSVCFKLQPSTTAWTLTGDATTTYTVDVTFPALAARVKNAASPNVVTNGTSIAHAVLPLTVNVHGGYAVFHHKDGTTTKVSGMPSKAVAAANTIGGVGVPTGDWGGSDGVKLDASAIVLGGRDATRHYYEIEETATYNVTYDLDGGKWPSGADNKNDATGVTSHTVVTEKPTKANAAFKGWDSDDDGTKNYTGGESIDPLTADLTLKAIWVPTYTVTYANSATTGHPSLTVPTDASSPYESGSTVTILGVASLNVGDERDGTESPTPKVYKFLGWDMGGTKYYSSGKGMTTSFTINADSTLTAAWEEVKYTVKYNMNGVTATNASSFTDETGLSNGATATKASGTPLATGKTFAGWKVNNGGSAVTSYTVNKTDATNHIITLYAQWTDQTRTVSYDLNGKTFAAGVLTAPAAETVTYGGDVDPLSTAISTSTNYVDTSGKGWTFKGWAATAGDTTAITKVTNVTTDTTVYAIWAPTMHTVTYAVGAAGASGAVAAPTTYSVQHGTTHTVKTTTDLTAATGVTDWKPNGWDETNSTITVNGDVTITGQWQVLVSFDENETSKTPNVAGVSGMPSAQWVDYGGKATAPTADPTASNWTFSSWKDAATGGNTVDFSTKTFTAPTTIYATWGDKDTTAVFYLNDGEKWQDNATDASITVTGTPGGNASPGAGKTPPVRADYTFDGWATTSTGTTGVTPKFPAAGATAPNEYYAIWTRDQSNIKFVFGNGATDQTETGDTKASLAAAKFPANPIRANYRFNGWKGDDGAVYSSTALPQFPATKDATLTITAQWVAQSTVVFDLNGGTLAAGKTIPGSQTGDVNTAIGTLPTAVAAGDVTKTGYTFAGWALNKNNGTAADAVTVANIKYPTTVNTTDTYYAIWTINTYTVTYDKGDHGGSDVPSAQTGNYNTTVTLTGTMNDSTEGNIHWIFKGWSTTKNDTSTKVTKFDNIAADYKVYALWEKDTHTLTYNANGGTASSVPTTVTGVECGTATAVDVTTVPTWNASHRFLGWDTDSTATTPTYPKGVAANITLTSNTTLYAIWESVVTVTWKTGGGTWSTALGGGSADKTQTDKSGSAMTTYTGGTDVTRAGYRFKDWTNTPGTTMPAADTTYTAQWDRLYNVLFDLNAPSGATDITVNPASVAKVTDKIVGETATLTALSDTQGNYVFKGWDTSSTATTATYTPTGTYTVVAGHASGTDGDNAKITLYGVWVKKVKVKFQANGGTFATGATTTFYQEPGTTYTAPADPTRAGYDFASWSASTTGTTVGTIPTADTVYTAQWTPKKYDYIFDANNGSWPGSVTTQKRNQEVDTVVAEWGTGTGEADPTRTGYTFKGWGPDATSTVADLITFDNNGPKMPVNGTTVYAVWTPNEYTVTYNVGKNTSGQIKSGEASQTVTYDDGTSVVKVGDLTNAATIVEAQSGKDLTGWTFVEWNDKADGTGNTWTEGADLDGITADMTLYAQWTVAVTFKPSEPEGTVSGDIDKTAPAQGVVTGFPADPSDLTHYTFDSWNTKADGTGTTVDATTTFSEPTTVYGKWTPKKYTVSFVDNSGDGNNPAAEANKDYNSTITLPVSNGDKTGYTFAGWYKDNNAWTQSAGAAGANYTVTQTETLYGKWDPVTVKVIYDANGHGTAPTDDTATYDGSYNVKDATSTTSGVGIGGGTWGTTGDSKPMFTDGSGNRFRFNGWKVGGTTVGATIDPVNTANGVVAPTAPATEYTLTLVADWTPLYTITYDANGHGTIATQPADQKNVVAGDYPAKSYTLISADTGDTFNTTNGRYTEADGTYWRFIGWNTDKDAAAATYQPTNNVTLPDATTKDVKLYAIWESQVEVKLGAAADAKNAGNAPAANTISAALNGGTRTSGHTTDGVFVKAGTAVNLTSLTVPSGYNFAYWTATADTGAFDTTKNDKAKDATFTPTKNTTLTPYYWKTPTLSGTDGYHLNYATGANVPTDKWSTATNKKATNTLPAYTWTQNDADLAAADEFQIERTTGTWTPLRVAASAGPNVDVVKTVSGNTVTYTIQESYLTTLSVPANQTVADYPIRVVSKTPDYTTTEPNAADTTRTSLLQVVVTPDPLTKVDVLAKGRTQMTETAKVGDGTGANDNVHYASHVEPSIIPTNLLTYAWYVSNNHTDYPAQHSYTNTTTGASGNAAYLASATADAAAKGTLITGVTGDTVPVDKAAYKGKWIYAVVSATNTGYGAVITNAIAVDYDAKIAVNKDNDPVPGNKAGGYRVFLVPSTAPADLAISAEGNLTGTGVVPTTNGGTNNVYATADSALTGGATYYAYVNKVEGDFTQYEKTSVSVSTQVDTAGTAQTIDFYSVNAEGTDKLNKTDSKGDDVGESFGASDAQLPDIGFTTDKTGGGTIAVPDGNGVLKGSKVTAKTDDKTWQQDYKVNWGVTTTEPTAAAPLTYTTVTNQTRDAAFDTGTGERTISQKTWMGAQLEQRVYSVVGNIWATGTTKTAGILTSGAGNVPTLTYGTYRFDGTVSGTGIHRNTVTFTVPKSGVTGAIAGQYVLSAKPKTSPKTTILKLAEGNTLPSGNTTADDTTVLGWNELSGTNKDTLADIAANTNPAFTIVVAASTYVLDLAETSEGAGNKAAHGETDGAATTPPVASGGAVATRAFSEDYAARVNTAKAYTFAVTNNGNTTLKVSLKVKKGGTDVYGTGVTGSGILTDADGDGIYEDANGMTFAGLQTSFDLAPGATSGAITVTIPSPLGVKDVANYDFEFTSVQKDIAPTVYGPSVTYKLTEAVKPWKITGISAKAAAAGAGYDYVADETALVLKNDAEDKTLIGKDNIETQGIDLTTAPEVEYTWWRGPYGASLAEVTAAFDATNGVFTDANYEPADGDNGDGTYTYHTNDQGKAVYVVAKFKGTTATRTGNVVRSAFDFPAKVAVPYDMKIQINENSTPVKDANKGNYDLYLVPTGAVAGLDWAADLAGQGIITGAHDATGGADQGKWAVTGLVPGTEYKIYTNAVGSDHTAANRKDSGETVKLSDFLDGVDKIVTYHNVVIQNTVADNSPYTITTSDSQFVNTADGTTTTIGADSGALVKPSASFGGVTVAASDASADRWVQKGTTIALSYADWNRDYKLEWSNAASGTVTGDPTGAASSTATVNGANTTVETKLTLNTYAVAMTVRGAGSLDWVTLTEKTTGKVFTTNIGAGDLHATGTAETDAANGKTLSAGNYTFTVPKGNYTITAQNTAGTTIKGYEVPIGTTVTGDIAAETLAVQADDQSFLIDLQAVGQSMQVEDDQKPIDNTTITAHTIGSGSVDGTTVKNGQGGSTIHLPYGYTAAKTVQVEVRNTSGEGNSLYDVKWTPDSGNATTTGGKISAVYNDLDGSKDILYENGSAAADAPLTATLTVATGLAKGTYTYTAVVTFDSVDGDDTYQPEVTYTLTVVVDPAEFNAVSITKAGGSTDIGTAQVELGQDLEPLKYGTTTPDLWNTGLIADGADYSYHWFYTDPGKTVDITWDKDTGTIAGGADATEITTGITGNVLSGTEIAKHPGKLIYLAVVAAKDKNVIKAALSQPVTTGFQPVVKIAEDHGALTSAPANTTDYVVTLTQGGDTWPTVWDDTAKGFVPVNNLTDKVKVSLDATKSYTANVNKYKGASGAAADLVAQTSIPLTLANPTRTIPYFTVNAVKTKAFEGITSLGETFDGDDDNEGPTPTLKFGANVIASGTPVLKGQGVSAAIADGDKWTQDYKLTWYDKQDGNTSGTDTPPTFADAYEDTNPTMTARGAKQDVNTAATTGHTVTAVNDTTYIGGRLDQNTYTIKATVKGTGTLSEVTLDQMDGSTTSRRNYAFTNAATDDKVSTNASGASLGKDQYVTFTVVKGGFDLAATPGNGTVISSMVWEETGDTVNDGAPLTGKTVAATGDDKEYAVTINLTATELKLKVADDGGKDAESDAFTVNHVTNGVERYFNYIRMKKADALTGDTYEYELTLTNPGNKDLYAAMDVYYFADPSVLSGANYYSTVGNWEDVTSGGTTTPAVNTPIFSADATTTAKDLKVNNRTVLALSELMATGSKVAKDSGTQKVGKLTLGTDTWVKDDGAFVFRFKGTTGTASDQPVYVYYVLDLTVDQLPIKQVETQINGAAATGMPGVGDKLQAKGYDATNNKSLDHVLVQISDKPDQADAAAANLTANDVHFAWVKVSKGAGLALGDLSVTHDGTHDGQLGTTKGSVVSQSEEYVLQDGDQDHDFYLVAFAPNYTGNVTNAKDMVISAVIEAKRTVGVQVSLDGTTLPSGGTTDPGYTVYFVEDGKTFDKTNAATGADGTWATTWSNDANKVYQAPVDMDTVYHVYAATTKGGTTFVDTGLTVGKNVTTTPVVPYWNVAHTANVAVINGAAKGFKSYLPDGATAASDNAIQGALSVKVSKAKGGSDYEATALSTTPVPVLEGMNVQVTVDGTKDNNNATTKESWQDKSDYHTLTALNWANSADNKTSGIGYADAVVSKDIPVDGPKSFSATLAPVLFKVTFQVKDVSDPAAVNPPTITGATLKRDAAKEPNVPSSFVVNGTLGAGGGDGDTVTFTNVPAGELTISADAGTKTMVVGYTWNDATATPVDPGNIVHVTTDDSKNKNAGNLIEILEATNMIQWQDNFDVTNGKVLPDNGFVKSAGFQKVDGRPGQPDLALKTGYAAADGDTLEYKVRVYNAGTSGLEDFQIDATGVPADVLRYSNLTSVDHYNADGTKRPTTANVAVGGFTLGAGECVEFTVTIPEGNAAQDNYYESVFKAKTSNEGNLGGGDYKPAYQVTGNIGFTAGKAQVLYGHDAFQFNTDLALTWDGGATEPSFKYEILALSGTDADADAATLALINEKLELTGANAVTVLDAKPDWVTLDADTGKITFTPGAYATGVNVEVKGTPANFAAYDDDANGHKVDDEVVLYVKATELVGGNPVGESFVTTYTVDVEPGQLAIQGPVFDPKNPEDSTKRPYGGTDVDKADFQYTKVVNQAAAPLDVIPAATNPAVNTGAGNDPSQEKPTNGKVFVNDGTNNVHTATWTVSPTKYVSEVATDYAFTVTYKPENGAEKWNYKPATWAQEITAEAPPQYTVTYDWNTHTPDGKTLPGPYIVDPKVDPNHKVSDVLTVGTDYKDVSGTDGLYWNFKGWNTAADASGTAYAPSATFQPTANVTLYAQWEAKMLNVTYKYNGNGTPDKTIPNAVQKGGSYTVAEADPTWSGRTFLGWSVTGGTPSANPLKTGGAVNAVTTNVVLTARWERDKSTIVYDWNYTGSAKATHTGNTGERDTAVPTTAPAHTGYTWDGKWYAEPTCQTQVMAFNFPATKGATVTYYAKWTRDTSKIAFALDGGTLAGYPQTYEGNTSEALAAANFPAAAPTKAGYTFTGWRGDDGKTYTASALPNFPATKDALLTITAQWSRDQSTITFDLNGGNIDGETDNIVRNGPTGTLLAQMAFPETPVREGYAFEYWLGEDAKIYDLDDRPSFPADKGGNLTITAHWRKLVQGLKFSDERSNDAAVNDAAGKITMVNPDAVLTAPDLQKAFPPAQKVERTGEYVVYLDTEPRYTVALHSVGDPVYNMSVTATDARGVKYTDLPVNVASFASTDDVKVITLDLEALSGRLWAGEHHILLTATGNTEADGTGETVTATYELTFEIKKRPIPVVDLIPDPTDPTDPDKTKVTGEDGEDLRKPDSKGNTPVDKPTITKTPTDPKPGETYEIKTTLEPDPNYVFEPENDPTDPTKTPNYTKDGKGDKDWPEGDPDLSVTVKPEDPGADVTYVVTMRQPLVTIGAHLVAANSDSMVMSAFTTLIGQELRAYRAQSDDTEKYPRTGTTYGTDWWWSMGDAPATVLDIQPGTDKDGKEVKAPVFDFNKTYVLTVRLDPDEVNYRFVDFQSMTATFDQFNTNLKRDLTRQANAAALKANTEGFTILTDDNGNYYLRTYYRANKSTGGGGGGGSVTCPSQVTYLLGLYGTTKDPVMEMVSGTKATKVPNVTAITGYKFLGWSLAGPIGDAEKDATRTLVDPKEVPIEGDTTFYAVYQPLYTHGRPFHEHYVIGYPNGNFGPSDNINRASVATIIARAVLPNFVEGADYGNPGGYSDVSGHWAASAIAYCTRYGVFKGYEDGTFRPDQPISRQELVLTLARLSGMQTGTAPFSDLNEAGDWAKGGIYTAYVKGWVNGYTDGTFRPTNPIARDETVKIFNAYLYRGVNAEGLSKLSEYVHSGVASHNTENGTTEYMTWPDVPKDQWAYYEIIEAANDHEYKPDETKKAGYTVPEVWTKCWIDEKWRYHDDANDGGPAAVTMALLRKYGVIA